MTRTAISDAHLALLHSIGAQSISHSKRTLLDHLRGTHDLLHDWGNPQPVCTAGLFHSIYGTYVYSTTCVGLDRREEIRAQLGEQAEALVYLFCVTDRRTFFATPGEPAAPLRHVQTGAPIAVSDDTRDQLIETEAANLIEQLPYRSAKKRKLMTWYRPAFAASAASLSAAARAALGGTLAEYLDSSEPANHSTRNPQ